MTAEPVLEAGDETSRAILEWVVNSLSRLARNELDEAVWFLHCKGGSYRFSIAAFRQDQPDDH